MTKNYSNKTKRGIRRAAVKVNVKMRNRERLGYPSNKTVIKADVAEILRLRLSLLLPA